MDGRRRDTKRHLVAGRDRRLILAAALCVRRPQLRLREPLEVIVLVYRMPDHVARWHVVRAAVRAVDALAGRDLLVVDGRHAGRLIEAKVERAGADVPEHLIETQTGLRVIFVDLALMARRSGRHWIVEDLKGRTEGDVLLRKRHHV